MKRILHILISFFLVLFLWNCAKTGSIGGGPKDLSPPVMVKSKPLNGAVNFTGNKIEITFDEYIKPEAIAEELVISPPFKERFEISMKGKTLIIGMEDSLKENTTYTLSFGEAIKDLNEGNVLQNFEFIFSTGSHLDSLAVSGMVLQAIDLKPLEEIVNILLYTNLNDSAPYLEVPEYMSKATPEGAFLINNIRPGTYRLFALQDQNRNLKYDIPEEQIGFLDSLIVLSSDLFEYINPDDSAGKVAVDTGLFVLGDSTDFSMEDSLLMAAEDSLTLFDLARYSVMVDVFTFRENNEPQYLIDNKRDDRRILRLLFNREVLDTVILEPLSFNGTKDWFLLEQHILRDTFDYWITDSLIYQRDSLEIIAHYQVTDSIMNYELFHDTLKFNFREVATNSRRRGKEPEAEKQEEILLSLNVRRGQPFDVYRDIKITSSHPIQKLDTSKIKFTHLEDTLNLPESYSINTDFPFIRSASMVTEWKEGFRYDLNLFPGAVTDIYGLTHDTITTNFTIQNSDHYGKIFVNLTGVTGQTIVYLIDNKSVITKFLSTDTNGTLEFKYLEPLTYTLKAVLDANNNGKWDAGNYLQGIQPEKVIFHKENIALRSNFDVKVNWDLRE